jgi:hypothetical protein
MDKHFKRPLKPKGTWTHAPNGVYDHEAVGKTLHEKIAPSWYPTKPNPKPNVPCTMGGCKNEYDPNTKHWIGTCAGYCSGD